MAKGHRKRARRNKRIKKANRRKGNTCIDNMGKSHIFISNDGAVFPSVEIRINVGHVKKDNIKNIWLFSSEKPATSDGTRIVIPKEN